MCPPVIVAGALIAGATVGAAVYTGSKQEKAAKSAAEQAARDNQAMVESTDRNSQAALEESRRASDAALAQTKMLNEQQLAQQRDQSEQMLSATRQQSMDAMAAQQAIIDLQRKAADDAREAARLTGQKAKAPNVAGALAANTSANRGGISGTMLTGPSGVDATGLTLGKNTLLGQ